MSYRMKETQGHRENRASKKVRCYSWDHPSSPDSHAVELQTEPGDGVSTLAPLSTRETLNNGHTMEIRWGAESLGKDSALLPMEWEWEGETDSKLLIKIILEEGGRRCSSQVSD